MLAETIHMGTVIGFAPIGILLCIVILVVGLGYVKAPPDKAFIITGPRKKKKVLIGRAGIRIPFFERVDKLWLSSITVDIKTGVPVPTNDFINVDVDAVAKVRVMVDKNVNIGTEEEPVYVKGIELAAKNFLGMSKKEISDQLVDSLQGNMREIIGTLDLRSINTDRDSFSDQVMEKASKDMERLGIEIISCNIQNVTDENGLIADLGADNVSKIKKDAAISKAEADKETQIAQAIASRDSNEARVEAETVIAQRNTELEIKKSELKQKSEVARADAEVAFSIQNQIKQKTLQAEEVNAQIARAEREAELRQREVVIKEQELEATIKKKADADKYQAEREAEANLVRQQKEAEAELFKKQKEAEAIKAQGNAEAEAIRLKGKAEAEAIAAKGVAEAEAMDKKAEAYKKYNGAAMVEMFISIMPQMAAEIAKPLASIDKVNIYGGEGSGVSSVSNNLPIVMKQVMDTMSEATGVDMSEIIKASTYDAKVNKKVDVSGIDFVHPDNAGVTLLSNNGDGVVVSGDSTGSDSESGDN